MWQYMPAATQQRLWQLMAEAGRGQSLAWLRFEPAGNAGPFELRLTFWRNGQPDERQLATAHPHGAWIRWSTDQE